MAEPIPGDTLIVHGKTYSFTKASGVLGGVLFEVGKAARVYKLWCDNKPYALKVFFPEYRSSRHVGNTKQIERYKHLPGLRAAARHCFTKEEYPEIINRFSSFEYAVLMPWIEGRSWSNIVGKKNPVTPEQSLSLARALASALAALDHNQIAHCDISSGNFVFTNDFRDVEFVDIEEIYSDGFIKPKPLPVGSDGYALEWVVNDGYWAVDADKFAAGILITEILCWQFSNVRASAEGDTLFASGEFGHNSKRFKLISQCMSSLPLPNTNLGKLIRLFDKTWHSRTLKECPNIHEWEKALGMPSADIASSSAKTSISQPLKQTELIRGVPGPYSSLTKSTSSAVLYVEPTFINFGTFDPSNKHHAISPSIVRIQNTGNGILTGKIIAEPWLEVSPSTTFSIQPGEPPFQISIKLKHNCPLPITGQKHMFPKGLLIDSNAGIKVVGGQYSLPAPKKWGLF